MSNNPQIIKAFSKDVFKLNNEQSLLAENMRLKAKIESLERVISAYKGVLTRENNKR